MSVVVRREAMRIAGQSIGNDRVIEVHNPWNGNLVGTVPKAETTRALGTFSANASAPEEV